MPCDDKLEGPASYSPSIEKTYGKPVDHWFAILDTHRDKKHAEQVAIPKKERGLGGHIVLPSLATPDERG